MRKITSQASEAFWGLKNYNQSNTHVWHREGKSFLSLHGNRIAELKDDALYITDCGWATTTTKERLN